LDTIALIGLGASNALLLIELQKRGLIQDVDVLVFDSSDKKINDKTYCFWARPQERIVLDLQELIFKSWNSVKVADRVENLDQMNYYMVESRRLYQEAKSIIAQHANVNFINASIDEVQEVPDKVLLRSNRGCYLVDRIFDSRPGVIDEEIGATVWQSFKGWKIETDAAVFDERTFTLMDFEVPQDGGTQFVYVLPFSANQAMIELTRFSNELLGDHRAEELLTQYCEALEEGYTVVGMEQGTIPMTQDVLVDQSHPRMVSMGGRRGLIKATTGYAFKAMHEDARAVASTFGDQAPSQSRKAPGKFTRFHFYDTLLLILLKFRPSWGKEIFTKLLVSQRASSVFTFLEERSSISWEVNMFAQLPILKFLWSVGYLVLFKLRKHAWRFAPLLLTCVATVLQFYFPQHVIPVVGGVLLIMLFTVGIPHGALDAYLEKRSDRLSVFVLKYLGIMALALLVWWVAPVIALVAFIAYSAWHFGQTDLEEWEISSPVLSLVWGLMVMVLLLLPHWDEVLTVLEVIGIDAAKSVPAAPRAFLVIIEVLAFCLAVWQRSWKWLLTATTLLATSVLPLMIAFGVYFVLGHSVVGWRHLKVRQNWSTVQMWKRASPFTLGAFVVFAVMLTTARVASLTEYFGTGMVFISALSLPHVVYMSGFYQKSRATLHGPRR